MDQSHDLFFGDLLKLFRKRKKLTQQRLAERIGVSRETISLWERGEYKPETDSYLYELVRVLGLTEQEQQQLFEAYTVTALASSFHNPPLNRNPYFTGRNSQLNELHTLLMAGKQVALTQAITGLGGIGKTQLALEYAYQYQKSYHDIFWAHADTEESLMASYTLLAGLLHLPEREEPDQNKVKEAVQCWFKNHMGWLLILDNVEDLNLIRQFVPVDRQGAVLFTTRRQVTEPVAQALELELLPEDDAILFLLKRTKVLAIDQSLIDASNHEIEAARAITHLLGNLPLALDQAGAYILETVCSLTEYPALFKTCQAQLLQRRIGEGIPADHPETVTATFRLNFEQVQQWSNAAGELLCFCVFLAPDPIPEEILKADASSLGPVLAPVAADAHLLNEAIGALRTYSLIDHNPYTKELTIHRLIQAVLRDSMGVDVQQLWMQRAIHAVEVAYPGSDFAHWPALERLLPHALQCASWIEHAKIFSPEAAFLLNQAGSYLYARARYVEAEPLLLRSLAICKQALGDKHPITATRLHNLALLYQTQGKYAEAELRVKQALEIRERFLGAEHSDTVISLQNLALLYLQQGKYSKAEPLFQKALMIAEHQLGTKHSSVALVLNNLTTLYHAQGKYMEAERLGRRSLAIRKRSLGAEHPDIALCLDNLATLSTEQKKYTEAESLYRQALEIRKRTLGTEHPATATNLSNLGVLYHTQKKYEEAEQLLTQALEIRKRVLGNEHPDTATSLHDLANHYQMLGRFEEAEPLYERLQAVTEQQLETEHPDVARNLDSLATLYYGERKYAEAEPLYERALAVREQKLGGEHPDTVHTLNNLARCYYVREKYAEAEPLYERALAIAEHQLDTKHPDIENYLGTLAHCYYVHKKYAEAEPLYERALAILEQKLGGEHPDIAKGLSILANVYEAQRKYAQAELLVQRVLAIHEQQLGTEHLDIATSLHHQAYLYEKQGKYAEAEPLYERALAIREQKLGVEHPDTMTSMSVLVLLYEMQGKHDQEALLLQRILAIGEHYWEAEYSFTHISQTDYISQKNERKRGIWKRICHLFFQRH